MANRLAAEISPYLLQHAQNPVDWFPWSQEALDKAAREDKPIFLSIGYSACHWCHVMERESFEDPHIAAFLNEHFVSIKVDREERPDLDQLYMQAVMALRGGQGGWPLSAFLTPEQEIFFGGTYWPPQSRHGMPGFDHVLRQVLRAYQDQEELVREQAGKVSEFLRENAKLTADDDLNPQVLGAATEHLQATFDPQGGGFGKAPKFPHPMDLQLLIQLIPNWRDSSSITRLGLQQVVQQTLQAMAWGGIYDHLGGGFARYSVDGQWLIPHFEKMLYDNALLSRVYLESFRQWGAEEDRLVAGETLDYVRREMTDQEGGFYSSEDADSEGVEGKFYVWTPDQIEAVLGPALGKRFSEAYGVTPTGNFEHGTSVLHRPWKPIDRSDTPSDGTGFSPPDLRDARRQLFAARKERVRPAQDDKVIVAWNGLMIESFARAAAVLQDEDHLHTARAAADFLLTALKHPEGGLYHAWRQGQPRQRAFLDDYANLIGALVTLYESSCEERWLQAAVELADFLQQEFEDTADGGFFYLGRSHEPLIARNKDWQDSSLPSGNGMVATVFQRLGALTGRADYIESARRTLQVVLPLIRKAPAAGGQSLIALDMLQQGLTELVFVAPSPAEARACLQSAYRLPPARFVIAARFQEHQVDEESPLASLFQGRAAAQEDCTLFVCRQQTCAAPVSGTERVLEHLQQLQENPESH